MQFKQLVRVEHLNHNGVLFGGYMLLWVDEFAYIAAMEDFPQGHFVTRGIEAASFKEPVCDGAILTFHVARLRTGVTSVTYGLAVTSLECPKGVCKRVFATKVTLCNVDENGKKAPLPPLAPQEEDDKEIFSFL